ncbi:hypothetical protein VNI00_015698 [Paramarasmius palmivorus]|uniref:F-box domain-containing protein n=1 Tax=Paramarasmius palmivorus TaxID=297713 RepID=A0AAW0BI18_9AGAR
MPGSDNSIQNDPTILLCTSCKINILPTCSFPSVALTTLRMNHTPSDIDIARTMAVLQEEREMQSYDEEIQRVRRVMERLEVEKEMLNQKMEERRSWLAPIRRLPVEILGKIFVEVANFRNYAFAIHHNHVEAVALVISQVSSHWRNVAFELQSIWSSIHLTLRKMTSDVTPLLQMHIENAATHPLSIFIDNVNEVVTTALTIAQLQELIGMHGFRFLQMLVGHFSRSKTIEMRYISSDFLSYTVQESTSFPILRSFSCISGGEDITPHDTYFWNAICTAPVLRHIQVDKVTYWMGAGGNRVPWGQLRSLYIHALERYTDFRFIITHCPQLETLEVSEASFSRGPEGFSWGDTIEPVELPSLRKLDIGGVTSDDYYSALASLILPSLKTLHTGTDGPYGEVSVRQDLQSLVSLVQRSSCALTELHLYPISSTLTQTSFTLLLKVLELLPCLEYLLVFMRPRNESTTENSNAVNDPFTPRLFSLLSLSPSRSRTLLPRLNDLQLHEHSAFDVSCLDAILDTVEERTGPRLNAAKRPDVSALKNVFICTKISCWQCPEERLPPVVEERVATLERNGTKCNIVFDFEL